MASYRGPPPSLSGWPFYTCDRSPILEPESQGEIVAIDVEGDVNVLGVQVRTGRIMEPLDLATRQDQPTNGLAISPPAFESVP